MLRFESGAFKSQYVCKMYSRQLNADMTSNGENFAICLDGVGGTIEFGVDSHHYARDFRDCLRTNIRRRVASADKRRYDAEVRSLLYPGVSAKQIGGGSWLRDLVTLSMSQVACYIRDDDDVDDDDGDDDDDGVSNQPPTVFE